MDSITFSTVSRSEQTLSWAIDSQVLSQTLHLVSMTPLLPFCWKVMPILASWQQNKVKHMNIWIYVHMNIWTYIHMNIWRNQLCICEKEFPWVNQNIYLQLVTNQRHKWPYTNKIRSNDFFLQFWRYINMGAAPVLLPKCFLMRRTDSHYHLKGQIREYISLTPI